MKVTLITVGKLKEKYWRDAVAEYSKRLTRYLKLEIVELNDLPTPDNASPAQEAQIRDREGEQILARIGERDLVIAMDGHGQIISSEELAEAIGNWQLGGRNVAILIGGSLGLSQAVLRRADRKLSMGRMTFPHQLARVMVLEQLYRGCRILKGEAYHK